MQTLLPSCQTEKTSIWNAFPRVAVHYKQCGSGLVPFDEARQYTGCLFCARSLALQTLHVGNNVYAEVFAKHPRQKMARTGSEPDRETAAKNVPGVWGTREIAPLHELLCTQPSDSSSAFETTRVGFSTRSLGLEFGFDLEN